MCLAIPGKIIQINPENDKGTVDFLGVTREAILATLDEEIKEGDYVLVHAGFAIRKINTREALKAIEMHQSEINKMANEK